MNGNLFFKRLGDVRHPERLSGPWKAAKLGIEEFAYHKVSQRRIYVFNSRELASWLDDNARRYEMKYPISVRQGRKWKGSGLPVPLEHVRHLIIETIPVPLQ